jgi:hypothetical protein
MANVTEEINFYFTLISINLNVKGHIWAKDTVINSEDLYNDTFNFFSSN